MSNTVMPLTDYIDQGTQFSYEANIIKAQFGDGYEQRVPNGINYKRDLINIVWQNISLAQRTTIINALATARYGADYLTYTPPGESTAKKFVQEGSWQSQTLGGNTYTMSVPFRQVFDL